jgi:hypothetical protein
MFLKKYTPTGSKNKVEIKSGMLMWWKSFTLPVALRISEAFKNFPQLDFVSMKAVTLFIKVN